MMSIPNGVNQAWQAFSSDQPHSGHPQEATEAQPQTRWYALALLMWLVLGVSLAVGQDMPEMESVDDVQVEMEEPAAPPQPQMEIVPEGETPEDPTPLDTQSEVVQGHDGTFELHVQDADLRQVLKLLSRQSKKNIVASKGVSGTITADLYGVTFHEALEAVLRSAALVYVEEGSFIYVFTPEEREQFLRAQQQMEVRVFRLAYLTAQDARTLITNVLSDDGTVTITPPALRDIPTDPEITGANDFGSNDVIVVRDYEANLDRVAQVLNELDTRPEQILIEATILSASLTDDDALGVDLHALADVDFDSIGQVFGPGGLLTSGTFNNDNTVGTARTNFGQNVPDGSATFGILSNNIAAFIYALQQVTDVTVLANPKLLVVNKQRGEVLIGRRDGYITTTVTETTATQTVEFLETGTRLIVRPFIGKDDFIRMEIHPEDSVGQVVPVGTGAGQVVLPNSSTTEVTSNIMVRDGRTIVIGGLFREQISLNRSQIPGLGDIPGVGALFRSNVDESVRQEVIILITPHIVRHPAAEAVSERLKDDIERYRIGARQGLQWWSRSRLANDNLRDAREAISEGNVDKARWHVDMALSLQPRMIEAIRLKEQLMGRAYWSLEPQYSAVRQMVQRMMLQDIGVDPDPVEYPTKPADQEQIDPRLREMFNLREEQSPTGPTPREPFERNVLIDGEEASNTEDQSSVEQIQEIE